MVPISGSGRKYIWVPEQLVLMGNLSSCPAMMKMDPLQLHCISKWFTWKLLRSSFTRKSNKHIPQQDTAYLKNKGNGNETYIVNPYLKLKISVLSCDSITRLAIGLGGFGHQNIYYKP